jgi:hypothetical protein
VALTVIFPWIAARSHVTGRKLNTMMGFQGLSMYEFL